MKRFRLFQFSLYAIFFISVFLLGILLNKVIELTLILASYFALRYTFVKTWHSRSTLKCIITSIVVFWIAELFVVSKEISILCSIIFGYLISYGLYLIQDYIDLKYPSTDLYDLTEEKLELLVKKYKLSDLAKTRLRMRYIDKMTCQKIADIENVELATIETHFSRIKKRLK